MTRIEKLERDIRNLSPNELATFREWFAAFDATAWDHQFEEDATSGKLDRRPTRLSRTIAPAAPRSFESLRGTELLALLSRITEAGSQSG